MLTEENEMVLVDELRDEEGVRYVIYKDQFGKPTTGVGHLLAGSPLPDGWTYPLTDEQVDALLESDLMNVYEDLNRAVPWWVDLNDVRQRVLCDMCFQLGLTKLMGFKNTLAYMRQGNWDLAAKGMLNSAWASQTPSRVQRLAAMMKTGVDQ